MPHCTACDLSTCSCLSRRFSYFLLPTSQCSPLSLSSISTSLITEPEKKTDPEGSSQQDSHPPPRQHKYAILQVTRFLRKFPNTYCIPSDLPEIKGPAQDSVTVQHPKGTFTARVNFIHLQQNPPVPTVSSTPGGAHILVPFFPTARKLLGPSNFSTGRWKNPHHQPAIRADCQMSGQVNLGMTLNITHSQQKKSSML